MCRYYRYNAYRSSRLEGYAHRVACVVSVRVSQESWIRGPVSANRCEGKSRWTDWSDRPIVWSLVTLLDSAALHRLSRSTTSKPRSAGPFICTPLTDDDVEVSVLSYLCRVLHNQSGVARLSDVERRALYPRRSLLGGYSSPPAPEDAHFWDLLLRKIRVGDSE